MGKIIIEIDSDDFYNNYEFFEEGNLLDNFKKTNIYLEMDGQGLNPKISTDMKKIKTVLTLKIGSGSVSQDFEFEVENTLSEEEIENTIQEYWRDWIWKFIDGGWKIIKD